MYISKTNKVAPHHQLAHLMCANPYILLMLQHLNIDFCVGEDTIQDVCAKHNISVKLFITIANLYGGHKPEHADELSHDDILRLIEFLKSSHSYYRHNKYPQISAYIHELQNRHSGKEVVLLERFFDGYINEVNEHLDYEDNVAFPYYIALATDKNQTAQSAYSSHEYGKHHTDIELKLQDLKNLLLKYVKVEDDLELRRKLFFALFELEFDLNIHSLIEETILIPLGKQFEDE